MSWCLRAYVYNEDGVNIINRFVTVEHSNIFRIEDYWMDKACATEYKLDGKHLYYGFHIGIRDSDTASSIACTIKEHYSFDNNLQKFADWLEYWSSLNAKFVCDYLTPSRSSSLCSVSRIECTSECLL